MNMTFTKAEAYEAAKLLTAYIAAKADKLAGGDPEPCLFDILPIIDPDEPVLDQLWSETACAVAQALGQGAAVSFTSLAIDVEPARPAAKAGELRQNIHNALTAGIVWRWLRIASRPEAQAWAQQADAALAQAASALGACAYPATRRIPPM